MRVGTYLTREDKDMKEKEEVEEKTRDEGKTRRSREERPSQEDKSVRPHDFEIIHPTSQTKPKNLLEAIFTKCLTLLNNLENPHHSFEVFDLAILSIHIKSTSCPNLLSNYH
jgi:hypothetical protein